MANDPSRDRRFLDYARFVSSRTLRGDLWRKWHRFVHNLAHPPVILISVGLPPRVPAIPFQDPRILALVPPLTIGRFHQRRPT